jgi:tight adherence protein B
MYVKLALEIFGLILFLLIAAVIAAFALMDADKRRKKFDQRVSGAIDPVQKVVLVEEQVSLSRTLSRREQIQEQAARLIGVDMQQAETYPVKWWLVPPFSLLLTAGIVFLGSSPLAGNDALLGLLFICAPVIWLYLTKFIFHWFTTRRNAQLLEQFPDALGTIVRCVRVGIPMAEALRTVSRDALEPTKLEFSILADKVSIGVPTDVALRELSYRIKLTEYQFFATAITLQSRSGGNITQTLETLADVIRKRVGLKARGYALTSEARMSSWLLAGMPFVTGVAIYFMQRDYIVMLFTTKSGQGVLAVAILLMAMGLGSIQYLINSVLK